MIRDKSHIEQVERWAEFCRDNPYEFRKHLNVFLDAQINKAREFYDRLNNTEEGRIIFERLRQERIKN